jgi:hypothetical protein
MTTGDSSSSDTQISAEENLATVNEFECARAKGMTGYYSLWARALKENYIDNPTKIIACEGLRWK